MHMQGGGGVGNKILHFFIQFYKNINSTKRKSHCFAVISFSARSFIPQIGLDWGRGMS